MEKLALVVVIIPTLEVELEPLIVLAVVVIMVSPFESPTESVVDVLLNTTVGEDTVVANEDFGGIIVVKTVDNGSKLVIVCDVTDSVVDFIWVWVVTCIVVAVGSVIGVWVKECVVVVGSSVVDCVIVYVVVVGCSVVDECVVACVVAGACVVADRTLPNDTLNGLFDVIIKFGIDNGVLQYSEKQAQTSLKNSKFGFKLHLKKISND